MRNVRHILSGLTLAACVAAGAASAAEYYTWTKQQYASPYGTVPTAQGMVDVLAEAVAREAAFENELYHTIEH